MKETVAAVIPAAGRSSRMGSPKALMDAGGSSFLSRILGTLRDGAAAPLLVVVADETGPIAEEARKHGGEIVLNPDPSGGPISSLQEGLRAVPPEALALLFCPVDHPLFAPTTVQALIRDFLRARPPLLVPVFRGRRGHPVLFGREIFPKLMEEGLPEGARTVVHRYLHDRLQVHVDDPGILIDIDTPEDYWRNFPRDTHQ
jgi:molybdenum cofactor cytidylyltransferase